jgi:hypothetical protein
MAGPNAREVYIANHRSLMANIVTLTPEQPNTHLPSQKVPDGVAVVVKSNPGNPPASQILVDGKPATPTSFPLLPGDSIPYYVDDCEKIFVSVLTFPPGVTSLIVNYTVEID